MALSFSVNAELPGEHHHEVINFELQAFSISIEAGVKNCDFLFAEKVIIIILL